MGTQPFEFEARCRRIQENMVREGVDYLFVGPSADLTYVIGFLGPQSERLTQLVIPAEGDEIRFFLPSFERKTAAPLASFFELVTWEETEKPTAKLARLIPDRGRGKRVSVAKKTYAHFAYCIQEQMPEAYFVPGGPCIDPVRMHKDPIELGCLAVASECADRVFSELIESGLVNLTEKEIKTRTVELVKKHGLVASDGIIVGVGANGASPHHHVGNTSLQCGDSVVIDLGGVYRGYYSDMTRTIHVGDPSLKFQRVYDVVREANEKAFAAVRPGIAAETIDSIARDHISAAGYDDYFPHRTGHGIGLEVHEPPYISCGNKTILKEDMTFCIEPGIYIDDHFGVRLEDVVVVTADGAMRLNKTARKLAVISK